MYVKLANILLASSFSIPQPKGKYYPLLFKREFQALLHLDLVYDTMLWLKI